MTSGALHVHHATVDQLQTAASSILAPLTVTAPGTDAFRADIDAAALGPGAVARIRGSGHVVSRPPRAITSSDPELLKVTWHRSGAAVATQGRNHTPVHNGDLTVFDMTRPYRLTVSEGCDVLAVGVPRTALGPHADTVTRRTAQRLPADGGSQAVLAAFLSGLGRHLDELAGPADGHLGDALVSLLIAAFADRAPGHVDMATDLVDRIRVYARANIADPSLCVDSVAAAHGISARHLHRLFRRTGISFAAWLRNERLDRIRRDLLDPAHSGRTAAAVAARWGIHDPRHLGRALKTRYGQTARELREAAGQSRVR
ncbi:helix-turn-helix domain-containing protein [Streptomyces sp. NPDC006365]|uniref:AraC-like ligand-binding domain-containing protein n=1 Tax=Streptomyces sp. NPDC006365 TaxID=3364744 RepID=UPI00369C6930